jgi:hypothetical protein
MPGGLPVHGGTAGLEAAPLPFEPMNGLLGHRRALLLVVAIAVAGSIVAWQLVTGRASGLTPTVVGAPRTEVPAAVGGRPLLREIPHRRVRTRLP